MIYPWHYFAFHIAQDDDISPCSSEPAWYSVHEVAVTNTEGEAITQATAIVLLLTRGPIGTAWIDPMSHPSTPANDLKLI